jgi:hypothetical protein
MTNDSKPKLKMLTFHYVDGGPDYINFLRPTLEQEAEIRGLLRRLESQGTIEEPRFGDRGREVAAGLYDSLFWLYSRTTDIEPAFSGDEVISDLEGLGAGQSANAAANPLIWKTTVRL